MRRPLDAVASQINVTAIVGPDQRERLIGNRRKVMEQGVANALGRRFFDHGSSSTRPLSPVANPVQSLSPGSLILLAWLRCSIPYVLGAPRFVRKPTLLYARDGGVAASHLTIRWMSTEPSWGRLTKCL